jgi:AbrB family looped-hinge helix DNA binding protein
MSLLMSDHGKKILAHDMISVRAGRGGDNPPIIITIPKTVATAFNLEIGEKLYVMTDGDKIILKRLD